MEILAAITSPARDDVIDKILRARGEWNPRWFTARQAPGRLERDAVNPTTEAAWIDAPPMDGGCRDDLSEAD